MKVAFLFAILSLIFSGSTFANEPPAPGTVVQLPGGGSYTVPQGGFGYSQQQQNNNGYGYNPSSGAGGRVQGYANQANQQSGGSSVTNSGPGIQGSKHGNARSNQNNAAGSAGTNSSASGMMLMQAAACFASACATPPTPMCAMCPVMLMMGNDAGDKASSDLGDADTSWDLGNRTQYCYSPDCMGSNWQPPGGGGDGDGANTAGDGNGDDVTIADDTTVPWGPIDTIGGIRAQQRRNAEIAGGIGMTYDPLTNTYKQGENVFDADEVNAAAAAGGGKWSNNAMMKKVKGDIDAMVAKATSEYKAHKMKMDSGGGGYAGGGSKYKPYKSDFDMSKYLGGLGKKKRKPASVAGMKKALNGEFIGVAGDNIFLMVHRRYQNHRRMNMFIEGNKAAPIKNRTTFR